MPRTQSQNASRMRTLFIAICLLIIPLFFTNFYSTLGDFFRDDSSSTVETLTIPEIDIKQTFETKVESKDNPKLEIKLPESGITTGKVRLPHSHVAARKRIFQIEFDKCSVWSDQEFSIMDGEHSPFTVDDDIWEDVMFNFFGGSTRQVNSGSYPDYRTKQCFESVGDYFTRSLRKIIWTTVIDIDLDNNPKNIPYFALYAASMGVKCLLFTTPEKAEIVKKITDYYNTTRYLTAVTEPNAHLDLSNKFPGAWALITKVDADGNEIDVLKGMDAFRQRKKIASYILVRFCPQCIIQQKKNPIDVLKFLREDRILVLGSRYEIPYRPNQIIFEHMYEKFIEDVMKSGEDAIVWLHTTAGLDIATPFYGEYIRPVYRNNTIDWKYFECKKTSLEASLENQTLNVWCTSGVTPVAKYQMKSFESEWIEYKKPVFINESEWVCIKGFCEAPYEAAESPFQEKCLVQVLPTNYSLDRFKNSQINATEERPPNLLVVLVDALSKKKSERLMSKTLRYMRSAKSKDIKESGMQLIEFNRVNVIGGSSGPNQVPLFSGMILDDRYFSVEESYFIWTVLREEKSYATLKMEDMCWKHSGLLNSLGFAPDSNITDHTFLDFYCSDRYYRPHCIGEEYVNFYMVEYLKKFKRLYDSHQQPWAAILNFGEAHEDSISVAGIMDDGFLEFFDKEIFNDEYSRENTIVVFLSDHGMHYGSYFQTKAGAIERNSPFFNLIIPNKIIRKLDPKKWENLQTNQNRLISPLSANRGLVELLQIDEFYTHNTFQYSLLGEIPENVTCEEYKIPAEYCVLDNKAIEARNNFVPNECVIPPVDLTPLTFYTDLRVENATYNQSWTCHEDPDRLRKILPRFSASDFRKNPNSIDGPNIVVIKVDGASRRQSQRHLKNTLNYIFNEISPKYEVYDFQGFNAVGYDEVSSVVALMSGCAVRDLVGDSMKVVPPIPKDEVFEISTSYRKYYQTVCSVDQVNSGSVWLFDLFKRRGYTTGFGSEYCDTVWDTEFFSGHTDVNKFMKRRLCTKTTSICLDDRYLHDQTLANTLRFILEHQSTPKFVVADLIVGRDTPDNPKLNRLKALDKSLRVFIDILASKINDQRPTVVVLMAGQGINDGWSVYTRAGMIEHRLPMLYMLLPNSSFAQYTANLKENQFKLTTPFDLYATFKELIGDKHIGSWAKSLFQEIPQDRLCEDAGIPLQYCSCDYSETQWNCAYNGEMGCNCTTKVCPQREGPEYGRLPLQLWEL